MQRSIRTRLTLTFIGLATVPLMLVGAVLAYQAFTTQQQQALNLQQEVAQRVAIEVEAFFKDLEGELRLVNQVQRLSELEQEQQYDILSKLFSSQDSLNELTLFDDQGRAEVYLSRFNLNSLDSAVQVQAGSDEFFVPQRTSQVYYSPVWVEEDTGEHIG